MANIIKHVNGKIVGELSPSLLLKRYLQGGGTEMDIIFLPTNQLIITGSLSTTL